MSTTLSFTPFCGVLGVARDTRGESEWKCLVCSTINKMHREKCLACFRGKVPSYLASLRGGTVYPGAIVKRPPVKSKSLNSDRFAGDEIDKITSPISPQSTSSVKKLTSQESSSLLEIAGKKSPPRGAAKLLKTEGSFIQTTPFQVGVPREERSTYITSVNGHARETDGGLSIPPCSLSGFTLVPSIEPTTEARLVPTVILKGEIAQLELLEGQAEHTMRQKFANFSVCGNPLCGRWYTVDGLKVNMTSEEKAKNEDMIKDTKAELLERIAEKSKAKSLHDKEAVLAASADINALNAKLESLRKATTPLMLKCPHCCWVAPVQECRSSVNSIL